MTDQELCKALRWQDDTPAADITNESADRIEALAAQVEALKAELLDAQNQIGDLCWDAGCASVQRNKLADLADALTEMWLDERRKLLALDGVADCARARADRAEAALAHMNTLLEVADANDDWAEHEARADRAEAVIAGLDAGQVPRADCLRRIAASRPETGGLSKLR